MCFWRVNQGESLFSVSVKGLCSEFRSSTWRLDALSGVRQQPSHWGGFNTAASVLEKIDTIIIIIIIAAASGMSESLGDKGSGERSLDHAAPLRKSQFLWVQKENLYPCVRFDIIPVRALLQCRHVYIFFPVNVSLVFTASS